MVFETGNLILDHQLALFQSPDGQQIGTPGILQRVNRLVQITMFTARNLKLDAKHIFGLHLVRVAHGVRVVFHPRVRIRPIRDFSKLFERRQGLAPRR